MLTPFIAKTIPLKFEQNLAGKIVTLITEVQLLLFQTAPADFAAPLAYPLLASILSSTTIATLPYDIAGASATVDPTGGS